MCEFAYETHLLDRAGFVVARHDRDKHHIVAKKLLELIYAYTTFPVHRSHIHRDALRPKILDGLHNRRMLYRRRYNPSTTPLLYERTSNFKDRIVGLGSTACERDFMRIAVYEIRNVLSSLFDKGAGPSSKSMHAGGIAIDTGLDVCNGPLDLWCKLRRGIVVQVNYSGIIHTANIAFAKTIVKIGRGL